MPKEEPKYRKLVATLKASILNGRYGADNPFPSIKALVLRSGLSKNTVLHALDELASQGLIARTQGKTSAVTKIAANRAIGLILPGLLPYGDYFSLIVNELIRLAREEGFDLLIGNSQSDTVKGREKDTRAIVADFIARKVAGVIYQPLQYKDESYRENMSLLTEFTREKTPVVLLDSDVLPPPARSPYDLVTIDNVDAGERLADHLFDAGAKNVHFLMRPEWFPTVLKRKRGVMCATLSHGLRWSESTNVLIANPENKSAVRRHLRKRPRPDAFVCENDAAAIALAQTLEDLGVQVPNDVMLAGFADIPRARIMKPALTTIRQPSVKIAETAFRRLLDRIVHPDLEPVCISMQAPLVVRDSTRRSTVNSGRA